MSGLSIAKSLELQLLRPAITRDDVASGVADAVAHHLASACVFPVHVAAAAREAAGSDTRLVAVIGYPCGQDTVRTRLASAEQARIDGADEVAVVLDHSLLVAGDVDEARRELDAIVSSEYWSSLISTRGHGQLTIVAETGELACSRLAPLWQDMHDTVVGFVQTSSGSQARAVTADHVRELRDLLPAGVAIKAVGGVATLVDALALLNAGAVRIGTGSAIAIACEEQEERSMLRRAT